MMNATQKSQKYSKQTHHQVQTENSTHYTTENNIYHKISELLRKFQKR